MRRNLQGAEEQMQTAGDRIWGFAMAGPGRLENESKAGGCIAACAADAGVDPGENG